MKPLRLCLLLAGLAAGFGPPAVFADHHPHHVNTSERFEAKAAKKLLDRAVDHFKKAGLQKATASFNDPKGGFIEGEYYVFVIGLDGMSYANGGAPTGLVGMNVKDLKDASGKPLVQEMIDVVTTQGAGLVEYRWRNPHTNNVENKYSQVRRVGEYMIGVGYYLPRATTEQAKGLLEKAVALVQKSGDKAFVAFNDPKGDFTYSDLYVFAIGLDDGRFYAHGAAPSLTGMEVTDLRDAAGTPLIKQMIDVAKQKGTGTVDYVWRNPVTNRVEDKHSFVQKVDKYVLGVGYYTR